MNKKTIGLTILVFLIVASYITIVNIPKNPQKEASAILSSGRLANLPESATNIKVKSWSGLFTGGGFLTFQAKREEIEKFISNSPSIKNVKSENFNKEHMYLSNPDYDNFDEKHEYFCKHEDWPDWYDPTIKNEGRFYEIPSLEGHDWGSVIVNFETNTVYIYVIWS